MTKEHARAAELFKKLAIKNGRSGSPVPRGGQNRSKFVSRTLERKKLRVIPLVIAAWLIPNFIIPAESGAGELRIEVLHGAMAVIGLNRMARIRPLVNKIARCQMIARMTVSASKVV
jgi:hypothetical protein